MASSSAAPNVEGLSIQDNPPQVIGTTVLEGPDGEPVEQEVTTHDDMGQQRYRLIEDAIRQVHELPEGTNVHKLCASYGILQMFEKAYHAYGGSQEVYIGPKRETKEDDDDDDENEPVRLSDVQIDESEREAAIIEMIERLGITEQQASVTLDGIFSRVAVGAALTGHPLFGDRPVPKAPVDSAPGTTPKKSMLEQLTQPGLALDSAHSRDWIMEQKHAFAKFLMTQTYPVGVEGIEITDDTQKRPFTEAYAVMLTNLLFQINGSEGTRHWINFQTCIQADPTRAGIDKSIAALAESSNWAEVPAMQRLLLLKSVAPDASKSHDTNAIKLTLQAYAAAEQWDQYRLLCDLVQRGDRRVCSRLAPTLGNNVALSGPQTVRAALANISCTAPAALNNHLEACRAFHEIRATAPWMMCMMGAEQLKCVRQLGPHMVRAAVREFVKQFPQFGEVLNVMKPYEDIITEFIGRNTLDQKPLAPIQLPDGINGALPSTARGKSGLYENSIELVVNKVVSMITTK